MNDVAVDHVRAVLARRFLHQEISITRAGSGTSTLVYRVQAGGETFWARIGEQPGERRDGEVAAHRQLLNAGVPVPAVVRYEPAPPELDRSIALTTHIPGIPLAELPSEQWNPTLTVEIGRVLAKINTLPVHGFGWAHARSEKGMPLGEHASRSGWTSEYRDAIRVLHTHHLFTPSHIHVLERMVESWADAPAPEIAALAHGDFDASHIYIDPASHTLMGIIDFGELRGADPLYDLGHLVLHDGESGRPVLFPHILSGYADVTPLPDDAINLIRMQAMAIGVRALSIQLTRRPTPYRAWLVARLVDLASEME